jgi:DNA mismatch repair protein MutL
MIRRSEPEDPFDWSARPSAPAPSIELTEEPPQTPEPIEAASAVRLKNVRVIGQARNMYILAESDDGLLIIDQHVAHERVLYEQLKRTRHEGRAVMQGLVIPITLELSRREAIVVAERIEDLQGIGFDIEPFGKDAFVVRAAPADVKAKHAEPVLRDIIAELVDVSVAKHLLVRPEQVLITTSCKLAIKAGDPMSMPEMDDLVRKLQATENPFVCPHGRPIIISLTSYELDRKFKRPAL